MNDPLPRAIFRGGRRGGGWKGWLHRRGVRALVLGVFQFFPSFLHQNCLVHEYMDIHTRRCVAELLKNVYPTLLSAPFQPNKMVFTGDI